MNKYKVQDFVDMFGDGIHGTPKFDKNGEYFFINGNNLENGKVDISENQQRVTKEVYEDIKRPLNENTILLSINGSLGKVAIYNNEKIVLGKSVCYLNVKSTFNKNFLKYIFETKEFWKYINLVAHGSTIKNLSPSQVVSYQFYAPDVKKQEKIVQILNYLENKIDINNKIIKESENIVKTIYDYWFIQFEFPDENGNPYKLFAGEMVYNERLKKEIPNNWQTTKIGKIINESQKSSIQVSQAKYKIGKYPFFTSGSDIYMVDEFLTDGRNCFLSTGGKGYIQYYVGKSSYSTDTWVISGKNKLEDYLYLFIKSIENKLDKKYFAGTGLRHLQKELFKNTYIVIPNEDVLEKFNKISNIIFDKISVIYNENKILQELKNYLLPLLMNGQIVFKD